MIGFLFAAIMGLVLGLLGGGGSILTVPILVYFFNISATLATGYSLFVVGTTSLISAWRYRHQVNVVVAAIFAFPSTIGVLIARRFLLQPLPEQLHVFQFSITKDNLVMLVFASLIIVISFFMMRAKESADVASKPITMQSSFIIALEGIVVGVVTGFVGAGGGFMIVPALTLLVGIPLREAIATSLLIIAIKSLIGFLSDIQMAVSIDWLFLCQFTGVTIIGSFIGISLNKWISVQKLRQLFAYVILVVGVGILIIN